MKFVKVVTIYNRSDVDLRLLQSQLWLHYEQTWYILFQKLLSFLIS